MRWAAAPQTLISDSQLDGSGRSSRHLHFGRPNPRRDFLSRLGSRFPQDAPPGVAGPGRTSRQHLRVSRLCRVSRRPPRGAPPVARFQSHFGTFQWVAVGKSFPLLFAGGNSPVAFAASGSGICGSAKPRQRSRSLSARSARPSLEDRDPSRLARTHPRDRQHGNHDLRPRSPPPRAGAKASETRRRRSEAEVFGRLGHGGFPVHERSTKQDITNLVFQKEKCSYSGKETALVPSPLFRGSPTAPLRRRVTDRMRREAVLRRSQRSIGFRHSQPEARSGTFAGACQVVRSGRMRRREFFTRRVRDAGPDTPSAAHGASRPLEAAL